MQDNPLKQYFRRPSIYIKLPSGGQYYTTDVVERTQSGELAVYPMTAIDEITARTPDALFNGTAVVDIIRSCVPSIKDPWKINSIDIDAIFMAIKIASSGETMDVDCICPKCSGESKFGVNMTNLLNTRKNIDYQSTLKIRDLELKFKPLIFEETNKISMTQFEIQKALISIEQIEDQEERQHQSKAVLDTLSRFTNDLIACTIEYIKTPETLVSNPEFISEFMANCDRQTSNEIRDYSIKLREGNALPELNIKCIHCQHEFKQPLVLNITDFFV